MITLELTEQDAELFLAFRKCQDTFSAMLDSGVFTLKHESVVLWFDGNGVLISIRKVESPKGQDLYRRKKQRRQEG